MMGVTHAHACSTLSCRAKRRARIFVPYESTALLSTAYGKCRVESSEATETGLFLTIEGDAAKTSLAASATPAYSRHIPVDGHRRPALLEVEKVDTAMAIAVAAASNHRCGDQYSHRISRELPLKR